MVRLCELDALRSRTDCTQGKRHPIHALACGRAHANAHAQTYAHARMDTLGDLAALRTRIGCAQVRRKMRAQTPECIRAHARANEHAGTDVCTHAQTHTRAGRSNMKSSKIWLCLRMLRKRLAFSFRPATCTRLCECLGSLGNSWHCRKLVELELRSWMVWCK